MLFSHIVVRLCLLCALVRGEVLGGFAERQDFLFLDIFYFLFSQAGDFVKLNGGMTAQLGRRFSIIYTYLS